MTDSIWKLDAYQIGDLVRGGDVAAKEVLEVFLERIDAHNEEMNALVYLDADRARSEAAEVDRRIAAGDDPGPLAGVPVGIKELEHVAGWPATGASVPHKDEVAERDGVQTLRLRAAGAVIVGLTASPEFGSTAYTRSYLHGTTRNPWNLERTPGGSSGGSAAAVGAAMLPIASGSDGGGSIRIPASYTGLFGAKGTFGRIPKGTGPESSLTSLYGCMARSVRDAARWWDCVVGAHERDAYSLPHPGLSYETTLDVPAQGLRATWSDDLGYGATSREVARIAQAAATELMDAAGMHLVDRPIVLKDMSVAWGLFNHPGTWLDVRDHWPERSEEITPPVRTGVRDAETRFNVAEVARAVERRYQNNQILAEIFEVVDVIITPTTGTTAFRAEGPPPREVDGLQIRNVMHTLFTYPFNISGHPAFSLPCGLDSEGLPVGLQIVTRRHDDHVLFQLARAFERARPWPKIATAYDG